MVPCMKCKVMVPILPKKYLCVIYICSHSARICRLWANCPPPPPSTFIYWSTVSTNFKLLPVAWEMPNMMLDTNTSGIYLLISIISLICIKHQIKCIWMQSDPVLCIARRHAHIHKTLGNGAIGIYLLKKYCKDTQDEYSRHSSDGLHFFESNINSLGAGLLFHFA